MPRISPPGAHLPGLDGLRAYAVLVVVLFHCDVPGFTGGWIGVDVFFGLSGFLITGILANELDRTGTVSLRDFWRRRMRRLVPALVVLMLFCIVLALTVDLEMRTSGVWGAVTYTTNWVHILVPGNGYWDAFAAPDPLEHLWSLAIEEQFYVIWPIVVLVVGRGLGRSGLARVAVGLATLSLALQLGGVASGWSIDRLYQGTDTRAFPFLLGSALALVGIPEVSRRVSATVSVSAVAVLAAATIWLDGSERSIFLGPLQLVSLAGVAFVAVAAHSSSRLLVHDAPRAIGRWSYGIYLVHWPLVLVVPEDLPVLLRATIVTVASTAFAAASHHLVEHPIRVSGLPGRRRVLAPIAMGAALVGSLVLAVPVVPDAVADRPDNAIDWDSLPPPAAVVSESPDDAVTTTVPPPLRVAVVGDSVPALAAPAIVAAGTARGWQVSVLAEPGCVPSPHEVDQFEPVACAAFTDELAERIAPADTIVFWWGGTGRDIKWNGALLDVCTDRGRAAVDARAEWLHELAGDRPVVVVAPVDRTDLDTSDAEGTACERDEYIRAAATFEWSIVRLDRLVCPSYPDDCDRLSRPDGMHYSADAAPRAAGWVLDAVGDPASDDPPVDVGGPAETVVDDAPVRSVLVMGDSTASVVAHGLTSAGRFDVLDGGVWGCPLVPTVAVRPTRSEDRSTAYCPGLEQQVGVIDLFDPDVVVLVASPPHQWDHRYVDGGEWEAPGSTGWIDAHDRYMDGLVTAHPELPIVVFDAPGARAPSDDALEDSDRLAAWNAQIRRWADAHPEVVVLDWAGRLPEPGTATDRELRPDGVHLTDEAVEDLTRRYLTGAVTAAVAEARRDIAAAS